MSKKRIALVLTLWIFGTSLIGQTDPCVKTLRDANTKYNEGWYDQSINLVTKGVEECDYSKQDKILAYRILILNYLATDKLEQADEYAQLTLKLNPNYRPDKLRDPEDLVRLYEKFKTIPAFRVGIVGGANTSFLNAVNTYSIYHDDNSTGLANYKSQNGFQIGLSAEARIISDLWIQTGFVFREVGYENHLDSIQGRTVFYKERLSYFDVPLNAKYYFLNGKFQPYLNAGINFSFLNSALGELSRDNVKDIVDRSIQRNEFMLGYNFGAGLAYQFKSLSFQLGVNYLLNPDLVNKEGTRFENLEHVFKYYYIDNDFTLDNLQINLSVNYAIVYRNRVHKN